MPRGETDKFRHSAERPPTRLASESSVAGFTLTTLPRLGGWSVDRVGIVGKNVVAGAVVLNGNSWRSARYTEVGKELLFVRERKTFRFASLQERPFIDLCSHSLGEFVPPPDDRIGSWLLK